MALIYLLFFSFCFFSLDLLSQEDVTRYIIADFLQSQQLFLFKFDEILNCGRFITFAYVSTKEKGE